MEEFDGSEPAFPSENAHQTSNSTYHYQGISIRDHFAIQALPAIYADTMQTFKEGGCPCEGWRTGVALDAYMMADAMLKARKVNINSK